MPTYDYVCDACGHALEIYQAISDAPKRKCPKCGKAKLARRIGAGAGFLFKGSGFHKTDYPSESYKAGVKADTNAAPSAGSTADAPKADSKPEPKAKDAPKTEPKVEAKPVRESKPKKSKHD